MFISDSVYQFEFERKKVKNVQNAIKSQNDNQYKYNTKKELFLKI
jgi:hypothetical protein